MKSKLLKFIMLPAVMAGICLNAPADNLVILHTNDTHSQIDPEDHNFGGVMRRKAVIDSVRGAEKNVLLMDAGDVVQGTLYFTLYRGEVEHKVMNALGYDIATLGNHEFDNGSEELAGLLRNDNATWVSTNYDVDNSPLAGLIVPYVVKEYDGKIIGIMGLNLDPKGMISDRNVKGIEYIDVYEAAEHTAWSLKHNEKADIVIALTHIGYSDDNHVNDTDLAARSKNIDLIIGGHSHTPLNPANPNSKPTRIKNALGRDVVLAQNSSMGTAIGKVEIDFDNDTIISSVIPVNNRLDDRVDEELKAMLAPYRHKVDSLMDIKLVKSDAFLDKQSIINIFSDIVLERGKRLTNEKVDMAILNNGGIRHTLPKGMVSEGHVIMVLPFENTIEVVKIKGDSLAKVMAQMGKRPMNGVSGNVSAVYDPSLNECTEILINGKPLDPEKYYNVATIDYLAEGGDYLSAFKSGEVIAKSENILSRDITNALKARKKSLKPDTTQRLHR